MDKYNRVKISQSQTSRAKQMMNRYGECHSTIKELEEQMDRLQSEMEFRINELKTLRQEEELFHSELEKEHGPGLLDTQSLEWITK
jgi:chromosome segregation ATPase